MAQCVHRPLSQSGLWLARRVNYRFRERVGLDLLRRPRRPVVAESSVDPSTRIERTNSVLRQRLRRRSRAEARPVACVGTHAPSVCSRARAC